MIYDHAGLAAVTVTRIAADESEGPGPLSGRMRTLVLDPLERNGPDGVAELVIELAGNTSSPWICWLHAGMSR
ncbi:hypothetical protein [Pseudarthrobacter sp. N5]|uniref:hypothetical protein n=1 Tax=Pseudarthrobacter sp. N5 TaxID=3418416 RepID=UPI003CF7C8FB